MFGREKYTLENQRGLLNHSVMVFFKLSSRELQRNLSPGKLLLGGTSRQVLV